MLGEFSEEYLQEILAPVFRHITLKTEEEMNLLSPDALYAGFLGALFGIGVESVDAAVNGLPVEFDFTDSTTEVPSEYAEFADLFEDLDGWEHLKSLPKAEQEAFIESLTVDALEEGKPATALEDAEFADILSEPEDLENFKYLASLPKAEQEAFIASLFDEESVDTMEEDILCHNGIVMKYEVLGQYNEVIVSMLLDKANLDLYHGSEKELSKTLEQLRTENILLEMFR